MNVRTTILVHKGLHPGNATLITEVQKYINMNHGWFTLTCLLIGKENEDLEIEMSTNHNYIDQGSYFIFDDLKQIGEKFPEIVKIKFNRYTNNGQEEKSFGDVLFNKGDDDANLIVDVDRTANAETQKLKTVFTFYRDGNKRVLTATNDDILKG